MTEKKQNRIWFLTAIIVPIVIVLGFLLTLGDKIDSKISTNQTVVANTTNIQNFDKRLDRIESLLAENQKLLMTLIGQVNRQGAFRNTNR